MLKRLHYFLIKSYIGPVIFTFFISLFILLMQFLWRYIDDFAGKGLEWTVIAELLFYVSAKLVPMALPLAVLLSSIMTFGNFGENFELTAIKSAGVSLQRFMTPLIIFITLISVGTFFYSNIIIPYSQLKAGVLIYDIKHQRPELQIVEGVFYNGIDGFSIKIAEKDYKTNLLKDIMIYDHRKQKGNTYVTVADSGYMRMTADERNLTLTLYNGYTYEEVDEKGKRKKDRKYPHQKQTFKEYRWFFPLTGLDFERSDEDLFKNNFQMLNQEQLESAIDSLYNQHNKKCINFKDNLVRTTYFQEEQTTKNQIARQITGKYERSIPRRNKSFRNNAPDKNTQEARLPNDSTDNEAEVINQDSLIQRTLRVLNLDSIYKTIDIEKQQQAITSALNYARSAQSSINTQKKHFLYKLEHVYRHEIEWHRKFTLPFACLVFFFIGAPFGAIVRKGGFGTPVVISIVLFIAYYMLSISGEKFAREGVMTSFVGMWFSSFILLPFGIFLTYKATTDSALLNLDAYIIFFQKIKKKYFKKGNNAEIKTNEDSSDIQ